VLILYIGDNQITFANKTVKIKPGYYVYVGSAMRNMLYRIKRHFRKSKKVKWHIDYLTIKYKVINAIILESTFKIESAIARILIEKFEYIPKFGATDTKDKSHLFYIGATNDCIKKLMEILSQNKNKIGYTRIYWYNEGIFTDSDGS